MLRIRKLFLAGALVCAALGAYAQTANPKTVLSDINAYRVEQFNSARKAGKQLDYSTLQAAVRAKAEAAVKDIDATKIDAKDAYDWALVYQMAERHKDVCDLTHRFLTTNPSPEAKYQALMLMMDSCNALGEGDMLAATLREVRPTNLVEGQDFATQTCYGYIDTVVKTKGVKQGLKTLDTVAKGIKYDAKASARAMFDRDEAAKAKDSGKSVRPMSEYLKAAQDQADSIRFLFANKKAELLISDNKQTEAIKTLDQAIKKMPDGNVRKTAVAAKLQLTLPGSIAPGLNVERTQGGAFSGLESLRGKVVILDMFAHWCPPCKAEIPEMRKMYDDLKGQGLEVLGITTYYGYYKQERNLAKDDEFARMADFMKEFNMNWPVLYGDRSNFASYGVTGIPEVILIDRKGIVRKVEVGYTPATWATFRQEVEKLIKE